MKEKAEQIKSTLLKDIESVGWLFPVIHSGLQ